MSDIRRIDIGGLHLRLSGVTPHPNFLGLIAVMCVALGLLRGIRGVANVAAASVVLVMAESRMAFMALAIALIVVAGWRIGMKRADIWIFLGVLGVVILLIDSASSGRVDLVLQDGRARVWAAVIDQGSAEPFRGWGILAFHEGSGTPYSTVGLLHAHNQFIQAVAESGLLGFLVFVLLSLQLLRLAWRSFSSCPIPLAFFGIWFVASLTEPIVSAYLYGFGFAFVVPMLLIFVVVSSAQGESYLRVDNGFRGNAA